MCSHFEVFTLPCSVVSNSDFTTSSGAGLGALTDANLATVAGVGLAGVTAGGALFVGAAVAPAQVLTGAAAAAGFCALGAAKDKTGSYLPFLPKKDKTEDAAPAVA